MKKLIATTGLPASGKTTWADKQARKNSEKGLKTIIVCKDDIRKQFEETGWKWSREAEADVIEERDNRIKAAFGMDADVVISADTNFGKHRAHLKELAKQLKVEFEIKDFTDVPWADCINRDAKREHPVGAEVILKMHDTYLTVREDLYTPPMDGLRAIICDLDGTLALFDGQRGPYDTAKCGADLLNQPVAEIVRLVANTGVKVIYMSGREDRFREQTQEWLDAKPLPNGELIMRTAGDKRKDWIVKLELFNTYVRNKYRIEFVLDDRNQVVNMWRRIGLTCLQVNNGDF